MKADTKVTLGHTGLTITALGFGGAPLGGMFAQIPTAEATDALDAAWAAGIRYFDTAPMYGLGRSEHLIGQKLREVDFDRAQTTLSTKVGRLMKVERPGAPLPPQPPKNPKDPGWGNGLRFTEVFDYSYDAIMRSYEDSQQRFGFPELDLLYVHDIGRTTHGERHDHHWRGLTYGGGFNALNELKRHGCIKGFGLGVNEWEVIRDALDETDLDCCLLAGRYSLLDQDALADFLPLAKARDVALVTGGVFNSGILVSKPGEVRRFNYADAPQEMIDKTEALRAVCDEFDVPLAAAAIQFPIRHPQINGVVMGAQSRAQVEQNVAWFNTDIPEALWAALAERGLIRA